MSADVIALLRQLDQVDPQAAVWCACQCARTVLVLVPESEERPRLAIEAAERWARGEATPEEVARAEDTVRDGMPGGRPAWFACALGRRFNRYGFENVDPAYEPIDSAVVHAARTAAGTLANATAVSGSARWQRAHDEALQRLSALVSAERWPRVVPTPEQLHAAPPGVQVAWDAVCGVSKDLSVPELIEAHARAGRLGLDWSSPVQRAVAERTTDEDWVMRLLSARARAR